jgi:hypothetical protein
VAFEDSGVGIQNEKPERIFFLPAPGFPITISISISDA